MDNEDTKTPIVTDGNAARRERIVNRIWFGYNALTFIVTFGLYIYTIIIAVPVLQTCYIVAVFIMLLGTALGLVQLVPEFFRNFIKLEPRTARYVNYCFFFILAVRMIWLIASTVIVTRAQCKHISYAWISIYVNWGIFASTIVIVAIIVIVRVLRARRARRSTRL
ncbi:uncharacterized protein LOC119086014 [Bradysia coprophila]|uniref:uncharacterized protein LOC119086014 n=1 Tax=Bradysia coprophila TaxID=38358 RepID=UPI00187D6E92|nr:uncharacterized protein LOC119086014 [Bradysia coprophila]